MILAMAPMTADVETSKGIGMAMEVDPSGSRSIGESDLELADFSWVVGSRCVHRQVHTQRVDGALPRRLIPAGSTTYRLSRFAPSWCRQGRPWPGIEPFGQLAARPCSAAELLFAGAFAGRSGDDQG